ncbi:MAG: YCF48-related protein [Bacteroidales bacterium]|jgi:photosystem II stability/assembly factor-like uncharacterized protein|nr:YCF48-related protein [Bacteroidales bacterium]
MKTKYILLSLLILLTFHFGSAQCVISAGANQSITCGESAQLNVTMDWQPLSLGSMSGYHFKSVYFINNSVGVIVGDNISSAILGKTTDGGQTWNYQTSSGPGVSLNLNSVTFFNDTLGFFVGSATYMGLTMEMINIIHGDSIYSGSFGDNLLSQHLNDIYFVSPTTGFVVGTNGSIGKSIDGGFNWVVLNSGVSQTLYSVQFTSPSIGFAVGAAGTILKTTDSGSTWIPKTSNTTESLRDIHFVNPNIGYIVGTNGTILYTVDAGENWTQQSTTFQNHLYSIYFTPNGNGYISGQSAIFSSNDGMNWNSELSIDSTLYDIHFSSNQIGYAVGEQSTILKKVIFDTFLWDPATGLDDPNTINPIATPNQTTTYTVTATAINGCVTTSNVTVSVLPMQAPEICIVTVDQNNKNVVVWEKPVSDVIDSFYIYKETNVTNIYQLIGVVSYADMSIFTDNSSNPTVQSSKYQITFKDVCGLETEKSGAHKTMHLTINQGVGNTWNLIWEPYLGFSVATYNVYRGISSTSLTFIGSTSGTSTQYSDLNAPSGELYYQIEVVSPNPCDPSRSITSSRSNIASTDDVGIGNYNLSDIKVYPNPATDLLTISSENGSTIHNVKIYDLQGKLILNIQNDYSKIDISQIKSGLYIIQITTESQDQYHMKLTITK